MTKVNNILVLSPYSVHTVVSGVLNSLQNGKNNLFELNFLEYGMPEPSDNIKRFFPKTAQTRQNTTISKTDELEYNSQISQIISDENIDLIIPTKEKYVLYLSQNRDLFPNLTYLPQTKVIELFQDKYKTMDFLQNNDSSFPVAQNQIITLDNYKDLTSQKMFVKPAVGSGGKNSGYVESPEEFIEKFGGLEDQLIACEPLIHPEYNHTILVKDGQIQQSGTYIDLDNKLGASTRQKVVLVDEINDIANRYVSILNNEFPGQIDGAYNIDFLKNQKGDLVLTEVNVGRLPGGHAVFNTVGKNMAQHYVDFGTQK